MKVTYIARGGFCVELEPHVRLSDYFTGNIPEWEKDRTIAGMRRKGV